MEYSTYYPDPEPILLHTNWRGAYDGGTFAYGGSERCRLEQAMDPLAPLDWPEMSITIEVCLEVDWPAPYQYQTHLSRKRTLGPVSWMGALIEEHRDASGQMYRRNRYYDPNSGRFTQEDPIGLAGGLNLYGFGGGDPVNFSDPFGLSPSDCVKNPGMLCRIGHWLGNVLFGMDEMDPNSKTGALGNPGVADPVAFVTGAGAVRMARGAIAGVRMGTWGNELFTAAQQGGKHAGFLRNYAGRSAREISKAVRSKTRHVAEHESYLRNPASHVEDWANLRPGHQQSLLRHWQREIQTAREQIELLKRLQQ